MSSAFSARASTLATSVLPTPGWPSIRSGLWSVIARYAAVAVARSVTYASRSIARLRDAMEGEADVTARATRAAGYVVRRLHDPRLLDGTPAGARSNGSTGLAHGALHDRQR